MSQNNNNDLYMGNEVFWGDIHRYIDERKFEIATSRDKHRTSKRKCPNCATIMHEENFNKVLIDRCRACGGIYLDKGELELLFKTKQESGFIPSLRKFYSSL